MGTLFAQVTKDIADAMRRRDVVELGALRMLKAAFMNREVEKGRALEDAEERQVVVQLVKQRRDSVEQFLAGGRQDLADRENAEIGLLERFLPPAADDQAIAAAIDAAVTETGAAGPKDMGKVMKATLARLDGLTVDGRRVSELVKQRLVG
ncbi:MAG: GatB/YqeY domain-containing protein [Vicinamibacterales bacterium]